MLNKIIMQFSFNPLDYNTFVLYRCLLLPEDYILQYGIVICISNSVLRC